MLGSRGELEARLNVVRGEKTQALHELGLMQKDLALKEAEIVRLRAELKLAKAKSAPKKAPVKKAPAKKKTAKKGK